jgi:hypothetical protein
MKCSVRQMLCQLTVVHHTRVFLLALLTFIGITAGPVLASTYFVEDQAGAQSSSATGDLTPRELKVDFDLMRTFLEEVHPGLYRYSTKVEMDRTFATQRAKLDRSMPRTEFLAVTSEIIARIHCGHTKMSPDDGTQATMTTARRFPLRILVEDKRLVVLFNDTPDNTTIRPGMEITEINGHPAAEIIQRIWPTLFGDGDIETGKWRDMGGEFSKYYWLFFERADEFTVKAKDANMLMLVAKLGGVTDAERNANYNPANDTIHASISKLMDWPRGNFSVRFLKDPEIAEIHIGHLTGDDFPKQVEDTFKLLHEKKTENLIIDLRGSGGGDDMNVLALLSHLTNKPFRYLDHVDVRPATLSLGDQFGWSVEFEDRLREYVTPNLSGNYSLTERMHSALTEQTPGKYPFTGKLLILIDGGTFSGSADFCAVMHHLKQAIFIGEETGGAYYGNSSGKMPTITLPYSRLLMRLPVYGYWNAVPGYDGERRGTIPDYVVKTKIAALLRGVDEQLDLALKIADR